MRRILVIVAALMTTLTAPGLATILQPPTQGSTNNSWDWGIGFTAGFWDIDQIIWVYRPDLDTGGGRFQSPYFDTFTYTTYQTGPTAVGWGPASANPNIVDLQGPSLDFGPTLWMQYYLDGDASKRTGFSLGFYESGVFDSAFQLEVGENFTLFQTTALTEQDFDAHRSAIPEPSTALLLGLGMLGAGLIRRKRRS